MQTTTKRRSSINYLLNHYADFDSRMSVGRYWTYRLLFSLINFALILVMYTTQHPISYLLLLGWSLFIFVPSLAFEVRRLHDTNRSGWWMFITFVPVIGGIWYFVLTVLPGDSHPNRYGPPED